MTGTETSDPDEREIDDFFEYRVHYQYDEWPWAVHSKKSWSRYGEAKAWAEKLMQSLGDSLTLCEIIALPRERWVVINRLK